MRQVADDDAVGLAARLVQDDKVAEVVDGRDSDEVLQDVAAAVDAGGIRYEDLELLLELHESLARVSRRRDQQLWVAELRHLVLVVNVRPRR